MKKLTYWARRASPAGQASKSRHRARLELYGITVLGFRKGKEREASAPS